MSIPVKIKDDGSLGPTFFAFHGTQRRRPGDKFHIKSVKEFSERYMVRLDQPVVDIPDEQYDPGNEVDESMIEAAAAAPQQAGPSNKKKKKK